MTQLNTIAFRVFPSPDTNDHEVKIFVDGESFIDKHWPDMMGMDPGDLLSYRELVPRDQAHASAVVRCGCGIVGCGSASVRISAQGDRVTWDSWQGDTGELPAPTLVFARGQYMQAVEEAVEDHSWETPDRTASRLLVSLIDQEVLAPENLTFQWASGRIRDKALTISLAGPPSHHQILVHVSWNGEPPSVIARKAADLLKRDPSEWLDVNWNGEAAPPFDGPGWRR